MCYFHKIGYCVTTCLPLLFLMDNNCLIACFILLNFEDFIRDITALPCYKCDLNHAVFFSMVYMLLSFSPIWSKIYSLKKKRKHLFNVWFSHWQFSKSCICIFPDIKIRMADLSYYILLYISSVHCSTLLLVQ